ncbi:MAG: protein-L-isoaspartate(D-aspartate) O-methyltransferase [Hyphomicrobiales bacterium]|nr:protein-L-isoaspartate(D-aspartate) O-methyltransferase [Hyphomicrobiales bacterium]MCP5373172.1 protein-L-isoaspartate(D-aspartate) O-methyltransferase [Hyphomicrobiales bacterium]
MLDEVAAEAAETAAWTGRPAFSDAVMAALAAVPRHRFVLPGDEAAAYVNRPLPIGHGQTISQPYIVALMTDLLDLTPRSRVLEVGTGCGYQTAVLAALAGEVYSVEVVADLARDAAARLAGLGVGNARLRHGDGFAGWPEAAPFDAIIVTAAPDHFPPALEDQLAAPGRMVLPVGRAYDRQVLYVVARDGAGHLRRAATLPVAFVPMVPGR